MKLEDITPVVITYNEEPNISRCLAGLAWARRILVVDSGSSDRTLDICREFPQVNVVHRPFDSFARQCNFALSQITTEWTLSFDADYIAGADFPETLLHAGDTPDIAGYRCAFRYCIHGRSLRSSLYPPRTVLYRTGLARYEDDGHGHRVQVDGKIAGLKVKIDHDDRKSLSRWLDSQRKYTVLEAEKMTRSQDPPKGLPDRLRRMIWPAVPAALFYTLFVKRLILDGWPGIYYSIQRAYAELLLSLELLERRLGGPDKTRKNPPTNSPA
jgi:glycosyltransferase involved in cell wall biosynthesis